MGLVFLARINGVADIEKGCRRVVQDGNKAGDIGEAVVADAKQGPLVMGGVEEAFGVELVLLAVFEAVEKAIADGAFERQPPGASGLEPATRSTSR